MSIIRLNELPEGSGNLTNDDIFVFMDDPAGSGITKKISLSQIADAIGGGGGGNPFDQDLNTFNSPTFSGVTVSGSQIIGGGTGSGDGYGYGTIELVPDSGLYSNDQYLIVDPTAPSHIHLRAGGTQDASNAELIIGGEKNHLRINDFSPTVRMQTESLITLNTYYLTSPEFSSAVWETVDGNHRVVINDPSPTVYSAVGALNSTSLFYVIDDGSNYYELTINGSSAPGGSDPVVVYVNQAPPVSPTTLTQLTFEIRETRQTYVQADGSDIRIQAADDVRIYSNDVFRLYNYSPNDPIEIFTDYDDQQYRWAFTADGLLELSSSGIKFSDDSIQNTAAINVVNDALNTSLVAGSGISLNYDSGINTLTISTSGTLTLEDIQDNFGTSFFVAGEGVSLTYNDDPGNTLTVSTSSAPKIVTNVFNKTGSPIPKFSVVYINGGQGDQPTIALAQANTESTSTKTYGITAETIAHMSAGTVIVVGALTGVNTDQFNPTAPTGDVNGTTLWLSPTTPGGVTTTKPSAPNHAVSVGTIVRTHQNQGVVEVRIQNGYELEELHNVAISGVANNDIIYYNSATKLWQNSAITTVLPSITNATDNRILTSTGTNTGINAESNLTFNGTSLVVTGDASIDNLKLDGNTISSINNNGNILINPNGTGKVGIANNSPQSKLDILGNNDQLFVSTNGGYASIYFLDNTTDIAGFYSTSTNTHIESRGSDGLVLGGANLQNHVCIKPNGDVGVGTTSPSYKLDVVGGGKFSQLYPTVVSNGNVGGNVNTNVSAGQIFDMILTGSTTLSNPTNPVDGVTIRWRITQDGTGGHAVTLDTKFQIPSSASSPLPWSTAANAMDVLAATYHAGRDKWDVVSFVPGY